MVSLDGVSRAHAFITGGGGFLANHLARDLLAHGHLVTLLVRGGVPAGLPKGARVVRGDLLKGARPLIPRTADVVFHLAALSNVGQSVADPASTFRVNVIGSARLLEESRRRRPALGRFVLASTAQVYGPPFRGRLTESHPALPRNPYSASKRGAETLSLAYDGLYGVPVTVLRLFNVYGPGQRSAFVVPSVLSQCLGGQTLKIGNPWPVRDFLFVEDAARLFRLAGLDRTRRREVVNAGTGRGIRIDRMVALAAGVTKSTLRPSVERGRTRPNDFDRLVADPSKAMRLFGWKPAVTLEEGLARTAAALRLAGAP